MNKCPQVNIEASSSLVVSRRPQTEPRLDYNNFPRAMIQPSDFPSTQSFAGAVHGSREPQRPQVAVPKLSDLVQGFCEQQPLAEVRDINFPSKRRWTMLPALSVFQQIGHLPGLTYVDRRIRNTKKQQK